MTTFNKGDIVFDKVTGKYGAVADGPFNKPLGPYYVVLNGETEASIVIASALEYAMIYFFEGTFPNCCTAEGLGDMLPDGEISFDGSVWSYCTFSGPDRLPLSRDAHSYEAARAAVERLYK